MDFFGVKGDEIDSLSLIDRINLYFKGNPNINFSDEEMVWVNRASKTVTFQDVIDLAKELYDYASEKQEQKEEMMIPPTASQDGPSADRQEEVTPDTPSNEGGEEEKEWPTESDPEEDHRADRSAEEADLDTPSYSGGSDTDTDETVSVTDDALQQSLESLVDDNAKEWVYLTLPTVSVDKFLVQWDYIQNDLYKYFYEREEVIDHHVDSLEYAVNHYNTFKKDTQKTVNYSNSLK